MEDSVNSVSLAIIPIVRLVNTEMVDSFGREIYYMRLSVTDLCNLRCRYCMPEEGVCKKSRSNMLTEDEIVMAVQVASSLGINKLRITGGEPLVKKNILSICERCAAIDGIRELCMTTNGILLPNMAKSLKSVGVARLNISLDTLNPDKYAYITRVGKIDQVFRGIDAALEADFNHLKINVVLIGGFNDDEIPNLAELTRRYPVDVRFIELMPMSGNEELGHNVYVSDEVVLSTIPDLIKLQQNDGVARLYRFPGAIGTVGLISPVSNHFCSYCNRIRLTADGKLKPCLHSDDEYCIKGLNCDEMRKKFKEVILAKPACHVPLSATERSNAGRSMNQIGG